MAAPVTRQYVLHTPKCERLVRNSRSGERIRQKVKSLKRLWPGELVTVDGGGFGTVSGEHCKYLRYLVSVLARTALFTFVGPARQFGRRNGRRSAGRCYQRKTVWPTRKSIVVKPRLTTTTKHGTNNCCAHLPGLALWYHKYIVLSIVYG